MKTTNKYIVFKDSVYDQHATRIENVMSLYVTNNTTVLIYIRNPNNPNGHSPLGSGSSIAGISDDLITITTTADYSDNVFNELIERIAKSSAPAVVISTDLENISAVAYTEGT